jgi:hypothetical protein
MDLVLYSFILYRYVIVFIRNFLKKFWILWNKKKTISRSFSVGICVGRTEELIDPTIVCYNASVVKIYITTYV